MEIPSHIPVWQLFVANGVVFVGAVLQGSIGIGLSIVAAPILMLVQPAFVPVPIMIITIPFSLVLALRYRRDASLPKAVATLSGFLPGSIVAGVVIWYLPQDTLSIVFAIIIIVAVAISLTGRSVNPTAVNCVVVGSVTGVMATITSLAGPPIALLFQKERGPTVRGTIAAIYLVASCITVSVNVIADRAAVNDLVFAVALAPGLVAGLAASKPLAKFLDRGYVRPAILAMSLISATLVLLRYL